jgi:flagellar protein FlaG
VRRPVVEDTAAQKSPKQADQVEDSEESPSVLHLESLKPAAAEKPEAAQGDKAEPEGAFKPSFEELESSVDEMNGLSSSMSHKMRFEVSEELGELVVNIIDAETNEIIKTIPPEYLINLRAKLHEQVGMLLDKEL